MVIFIGWRFNIASLSDGMTHFPITVTAPQQNAKRPPTLGPPHPACTVEHEYQHIVDRLCQQTVLRADQCLGPFLLETKVFLPAVSRGTELNKSPRVLSTCRCTHIICSSAFHHKPHSTRICRAYSPTVKLRHLVLVDLALILRSFHCLRFLASLSHSEGSHWTV